MNIFKGMVSIIDTIPAFYEFNNSFLDFLLMSVKSKIGLFSEPKPLIEEFPGKESLYQEKLAIYQEKLEEYNQEVLVAFEDQIQGLAGFINAMSLMTSAGLSADLRSMLFIDKPQTDYQRALRTGTGFWFHKKPISSKVIRKKIIKGETVIEERVEERLLTTLSVYRTTLMNGNKYVDSLMLNELLSSELSDLFTEQFSEEIAVFDDAIIKDDGFSQLIDEFYSKKSEGSQSFSVKPLMCYFCDETYIEKVRGVYPLTEVEVKFLHDIMKSAQKAQEQLFWGELEPALTIVSIKKSDKVLIGVDHPATDRGVIYELTESSDGLTSSEIYKKTLDVLDSLKEMSVISREGEEVKTCVDFGSALMSKLSGCFRKKKSYEQHPPIESRYHNRGLY